MEGPPAGIDKADDAEALGGGGGLPLAVAVAVAVVGVRVLVVLVLLPGAWGGWGGEDQAGVGQGG